MWFINDITIKNIEHNEEKVLQICTDKNIKVGNAYHKRKWLGKIISDTDYPLLIDELQKQLLFKYNLEKEIR